jgi:outer membrane immunogenic protein
MRKLVLAALAASAFASPALAQDVAPFSGFRAEGVVGYDRVGDGTGQDSGSSDGVSYGGAIGYDIQAGGAVFGAEAELTGSTTDTRADSLLAAGDRLTVDMGRDIYVGGRIGGAIGDTTLIYAKAGYTNARVETEYRTPTTTTRIGENMDGFRVGAGLEKKLGGNMYVKGEYRYSNYGNLGGYDVDIDRHQVAAGVGIRF